MKYHTSDSLKWYLGMKCGVSSDKKLTNICEGRIVSLILDTDDVFDTLVEFRANGRVTRDWLPAENVYPVLKTTSIMTRLEFKDLSVVEHPPI